MTTYAAECQVYQLDSDGDAALLKKWGNLLPHFRDKKSAVELILD